MKYGNCLFVVHFGAYSLVKLLKKEFSDLIHHFIFIINNERFLFQFVNFLLFGILLVAPSIWMVIKKHSANVCLPEFSLNVRVDVMLKPIR